jgi:Fur family ferric uptake transcriptional regulator
MISFALPSIFSTGGSLDQKTQAKRPVRNDRPVVGPPSPFRVPARLGESFVSPRERRPARRGDGELSEEMEAFREFLRVHGFRVTKEREVIAESILRNRDHFDVDELFLSIRTTRTPISKASIYRAIPLLIESGLLAEVYLENGHMHYERVYGREHHSHLRCLKCRRIFEFSAPELSAVEKRISREESFKSEGHKFEIWGVCSACQAEKA